MSERKLLPCPFCGEHAEFVQKGVAKNIRLGFIRCTGCGVKTNQENCTEDFAIDLWNTRKLVEKVVEELNCDRCESCRFLEVCAGSVCCTKCHDKIIEIVKQGGAGTDDVCEWESDYKFISDKYKRVTGCGHEFYDLHHAVPFKYCPYCGKKIKVVE